MIIDEDELPEYMRDALIARIKAHNERRILGAGALPAQGTLFVGVARCLGFP